eukprot:scaffold2972_cov64-Phaeocystis_antarctica.AAC.13
MLEHLLVLVRERRRSCCGRGLGLGVEGRDCSGRAHAHRGLLGHAASPRPPLRRAQPALPVRNQALQIDRAAAAAAVREVLED